MAENAAMDDKGNRTAKADHKDTKALVSSKKNPGGQRGNTNAIKHGVYSRSTSAVQNRSRAIRRMVNKVYEVAPWLTESDLPTVRAYCEVERLRSELFVPLAKDKPYREIEGDFIPRKILTEYRHLTETSLKLASALGLTPGSRVSIGVGVVQGKLLKQRLVEEIADA